MNNEDLPKILNEIQAILTKYECTRKDSLTILVTMGLYLPELEKKDGA